MCPCKQIKGSKNPTKKTIIKHLNIFLVFHLKIPLKIPDIEKDYQQKNLDS